MLSMVSAEAVAVYSVEEVLSQLLVGNLVLHDVVDDSEDIVTDGHHGSLVAPSDAQPPVLLSEVAALLVRSRPGCLHQK